MNFLIKKKKKFFYHFALHTIRERKATLSLFTGISYEKKPADQSGQQSWKRS